MKDPLDAIFVDRNHSFNRRDFSDMSKEDILVNFKIAMDKIDRFEEEENIKREYEIIGKGLRITFWIATIGGGIIVGLRFGGII